MTPLRPWDPLAAEVVVDNPWVRLRRDTVRLPSGRVVDDFFVTEQPDVVLVFALTGAGEVVLVRQWRQGRRGLSPAPAGGCPPRAPPPPARRRASCSRRPATRARSCASSAASGWTRRGRRARSWPSS